MIVKVKDQYFNTDKEPIMLILSDREIRLISNMKSDEYTFCSYPSKGYTEEDVQKFMLVNESALAESMKEPQNNE